MTAVAEVRARSWWIASRLVLAGTVAVALLVGGTALRVWQVAREDNRPSSDAIVVLGSAQYDGRPSAVLQSRLDHALALYRDGVAPRVVTVGGNRAGDRYTEAAAGARYLRGMGVPGGEVYPVEQGSDTLQSVRAVAEVFAAHGWRTAVLVTDPWHELRTERMARDAGIDAVGSPTRSGPVVQTRWTELRYVARETAGYLYYRLFHRSSDAGPPVA
ncbi:MAG: YdcF family protein [Actinobacteria bacterium]|nr:YdcF family protein [Actinomycetota bacterium]MBI3687770.1 YdcF family protein [Actinomycetota bacterium]